MCEEGVLAILKALSIGLEDTYTFSNFLSESHTVPFWFAGISAFFEKAEMPVPLR
jgi:hypothetical protein